MFNYMEHLENAEFQDIKKFKKTIALISFLVLFGGIALLLAPYSAGIIHLLESIRVLKSTTWQVVLSSYGAFALVLSVISLYAIFLRKYPLKVQCYLYGGTVLVLLALIAVTVYKYGNNWLNSDFSSEMVLSKLLSEENKLVSKNWKYSTELHLLFQQIFMMPLFKLFSNWQIIRAMTVFFNNVVLIGAYFFMMRQLKISIQSVMLTSLFLIIPVNITYWDIVTFSGSYVFFIAQFFCCMGLFFKLLTLHGENLNIKKERIVFAVYCAVSLILGMGGGGYVSSFYEYPVIVHFCQDIAEMHTRLSCGGSGFFTCRTTLCLSYLNSY